MRRRGGKSRVHSYSISAEMAVRVPDIESVVDRLRKVSLKNFPPTSQLIMWPPGVSLDQIEQFESSRNLTLPEDVKEYLQLVNGEGAHGDSAQGGLLMGLSALSLEEIIREMEIWDQVMLENPGFAEWQSQSFPPDAVQEVYCDPKY